MGLTMAINNTAIKRAAGGYHTTTATAINNLNCPTSERTDKAFSKLRVAFAMAGQALRRTILGDGQVTHWAERWGLVRHLPPIDAARRFLEQIGGRL